MYLWLKQNSTRPVVFAIGFTALPLLGLRLMGFSPCLKKLMGLNIKVDIVSRIRLFYKQRYA
jgi:hypothetical protein